MTDTVTKLSDKEIKDLREVKVNLDIEGLAKGWEKLWYRAPFRAYQHVARKIEGASKKMMTGNASVIGFPTGIVLRNTSRTAYNSTKGGYSWPARLIGGAVAASAAVAGTMWGAPIIAGAIGLGAIGGALGWVAAGTVAAASLVPVFSGATLAVATATAAVIATASTLVSAPLNLIVGWRRTKASLKGNKLTQDQIAEQEEAFDRRSPTVRHQQELIEETQRAFKELPASKIAQTFTGLSQAKAKEVFETLKSQAEAADAVKAASNAKAATPKAAA